MVNVEVGGFQGYCHRSTHRHAQLFTSRKQLCTSIYDGLLHLRERPIHHIEDSGSVHLVELLHFIQTAFLCTIDIVKLHQLLKLYFSGGKL